MASFTALPFFIAALSIYKELGGSLHKHATTINLCRHVEKNGRIFVKDVVRVFTRAGFLRRHRTDTFSWAIAGLGYVKRIID